MNIGKFLFSCVKSPLGDLIVGLVFQNFSGVLPVKVVYQNDLVFAFWHPKPFWEHHIVIVPKKAIKNLQFLTTKDGVYIGAIYAASTNIVNDLKWSEYTLLVNGGTRQEVGQVHFHLCSGAELPTSNV